MNGLKVYREIYFITTYTFVINIDLSFIFSWSFIDLFVFNSIKINGLKVSMQILFMTIYTFIDLLLIKLLKNIDLFKNIKCLGGPINHYIIYNRIVID